MRHFIQSSDHRFNIISIDAAAKPKKIEKTTICSISLVANASKYSLEQYVQ
jgi:hypothetical protein